ncbi:MAG: OPT/YSL family transporter [Patescibacteria group bacterium]
MAEQVAEKQVVEKHLWTWRAFIAGFILAIIMCAINSYLVLRFGIMEEGPMIAALIFFAVFLKAKNKITIAEMVIVATMGSAGGSLGFISNFYAAQVMVGNPYTILEMFVFSVVTCIIGLLSVIVMRQILVIQDAKLPEGQRLPWVGAKVVKGMIDTLVDKGDFMQARYLIFFSIAFVMYVLFNNDGGVGWFPAYCDITLLGLSAFGAAIAFSPFLWGTSYMMGFRTCVAFGVGGIIMMLIAPYTPVPVAPHKFVWPGIMFLVFSGITGLTIHWRVMKDALVSLFKIESGKDEDPIMSPRATLIMTVVGITLTIVCLMTMFKLTLLVIVAMIAIGGIVLNVIATRAAAQTYFNPARVMGILLQGVAAMLGGSSVQANLTGAGFVAGSGAQGGNLTNDMAYGLWYRVKSSWQFWSQASTILVCSLVAALTFYMINSNVEISLDGKELAAPIAKIWATIGLLFDPQAKMELPKYAIESMWIGGIAGVVYTLLERKWRKYLPCSIGLGLAMVLPVGYGFGFFFGGVLMWYVLGRYLKISKITLNTIAVASIVGEGIGGIFTGILKTIGIL